MKPNLTFRQKIALAVVFGFVQGALVAFEAWCAEQIAEAQR